MSNIKTRESVKDIKVLDKAAVASERMKTALVRSKDQVENLMDDGQVLYLNTPDAIMVWTGSRKEDNGLIIRLNLRPA